MKIAIIGYSGAGKSTLARTLGELYQAEVLHLDRVHWLPGWRERDAEEKLRIITEFLNTHDAWVMDGNYSNLCQEQRLEEADLIVEMLFGRVACYRRARKRLKKYKGTSRPDMTEGCEEKIDWEFTKWLLFTGRTGRRRDRFKKIRNRYPQKTVVIKNQKQLDCFMQEQKNKCASGSVGNAAQRLL